MLAPNQRLGSEDWWICRRVGGLGGMGWDAGGWLWDWDWDWDWDVTTWEWEGMGEVGVGVRR